MPASMRQFLRLRNEAGDGDEGGGDSGTGGDGTGDAGGGGNGGSAEFTTPFAGFYGENGLNREALEKLPESAKPIRSMLEKYPNEEALYGGIKNLQYLASQKSLQKLSPDADDIQKHQHAQMVKEYFGVPDHPDGYGVTKPEEIPDEIWDAEGTNELLGLLHQHNASPELVRALAEHQVNSIKAQLDSIPDQEKARIDSVNQELQGAFGNELPKVAETALKGLRALGVEVPESGNLAELKISYTDIVKAGQRMTELISEDVVSRGAGRDASGMTAGSYRDQAIAIKTDPSNPFYSDFVSEEPSRQKRAQAEFNRLMNLASTTK